MEINAVLIDTNAYAEFFRGNEKVKSVLNNCNEIIVCPIVEGELKSGFRNGNQFEKNLREFNSFMEVDKVSRITINNKVSDLYSDIITELRKKGTPIPTNDIWICACAKAFDLLVLTFDKHFNNIEGIQVINQ
jgi:tRNA(fMet)-specific endonuclease VapC